MFKKFIIFLFLFFVPFIIFAESDEEYLRRLERELTQEEKFLESIVEDLIAKGNKEFIETMIYKMGYERATDKVPRIFFLTQFGGGPMISGGLGLHLYNRQFYSYITGGRTPYGKYKNYSFSFINEVKLLDVYIYKRNKIDFLLGANISFFSEPGAFISSVTFKQIYYIHEFHIIGIDISPYSVINVFFDKTRPIFQLGIGFVFYPWG